MIKGLDNMYPVVVLQDLDRNKLIRELRLGSMSEKGVKEVRKKEGFYAKLPIPFSKGEPCDFQTISPDQQRKFIAFMFQSQYKKTLPNSSNAHSTPPEWWPDNVTFDKRLHVKAAPSQRGSQGQQKALSKLISCCYKHFGVTGLLSLATELSSRDSRYVLQKADDDRTWRIENKNGELIAIVDRRTKYYDTTRKERPIFVEKECQENLEIPNEKTKPETRLTKNQNGNKSITSRASNKRKLFDEDEEEEFKKANLPCKYCGKRFGEEDFRDEHQHQCLKGPFSRDHRNQLNFINALGLLGPSQEVASNSQSSNCAVDPNKSKPRSLRKLPKRNQLLSIIKSNPIVPLTSIRGQQLIKEMGDKVEHKFPPEYERQCQPKTGFPISEKEFPTVTKRMIIKHGDDPHIYSRGKRQRMLRYQELVIGAKKCIWHLVNRCKPMRLVLKRRNPRIKRVTVPRKVQETTFLQRKFKGALKYPVIELVDIKRYMPDGVRLYVPNSVPTANSCRPGSSRSIRA